MKKTILAALAALVLGACNDPNGYVITGRLELPSQTDSVYLLSQTDREHPRIAAASVDPEKGTFTLKGIALQHDVVLLADRHEQGLATIVLEPGSITVTPTEGGSTVSGTPANDALQALETSLMQIQEQWMASIGDQRKTDSLDLATTRLITETIRTNPDNLAGAYLLDTWVTQFDLKQAEELQAGISAKFAEHPLTLRTTETLEAIRKTEIGQPRMDIALRGTDGEVISLSEVAAGKWVLIDFWASWCGPCMQELPHLKKAYETYRERGFTIFGVSLDQDREAWLKCLAAQQMTWPNVNAFEQGEPDPVVHAYGIRTIPANFLVSPEGVIVAKHLRGEQLLERLAEVIE